jgi:hypothetical protein
MLVSALQLLALDYDLQVASLPTFVHVPDELALNFGDCFVLVPQMQRAALVDEAAVEKLNQLRGVFSEMSKTRSLWVLEEVRSSPSLAGGPRARPRLAQAPG